MTDDIVDRLRDVYAGPLISRSIRELRLEAANEIDRLRAQLKEWDADLVPIDDAWVAGYKTAEREWARKTDERHR